MNTRRLFVVLFAIALFAMAVRETLDPDMWWHLRTGEYIVQQGIPRLDVFSFTVPDHAWTTHEWLAQVFMWGVYQVGGLPGLIVVFAGLTALSYWLVYRVCAGRPFLAAFMALLAAVTSAIVWGARPQIFNILFTAVFLYIIERYRQGTLRQRWLWLLPLFTILWANFHSGYLLGVVLLGTYAVGDAATDYWKRGAFHLNRQAVAVNLGVMTVVSFFAAALNLNGPELWIYPFLTLGSGAMQAYIQEWHSPDFHLTYFWPFALMLLLGMLAFVFSEEKPTVTDLLLFVGTGAAGLVSARNIPLFAVVTLPILCRHLLSSLRGSRFYPMLSGEAPDVMPARPLQIVHWGIVGLALLTAVAWSAHKVAANEAAIVARYPVAAVDFLEQSGLTQQRGYNSYNWGGYLIWRDVPVFVDGRADVYGDDFLFYYRQTFDALPTWREPLDAYAVDYIIMETGSSLTALLAASGEWQVVYGDKLAQIFVRRDK